MASRFMIRSAAAVTEPVYAVFGATGGVGKALAAKLIAQKGAKVALIARSEEKLSALQEELQSGAGRPLDSASFLPLIADVLQPKEVDASIAEVVKAFGRVDGVTNCAGSVLLKAAHTTTDKEFMDTLNINLVSSFNILRPSVKAMMKSGGGSIALCSSAVARHGLMNHEAIAAAKGGVTSLALSAAATYASKNIRLNVVAPGLTRTAMTERITSSEAALKASTAMHALKRIGEPEEVAAALEFLLHPSNSFITGQVLGVDGGLGSVRSVG
eukprot:jgi/Tetstr1/431985/TSEL_021462.t1